MQIKRLPSDKSLAQAMRDNKDKTITVAGKPVRLQTAIESGLIRTYIENTLKNGGTK